MSKKTFCDRCDQQLIEPDEKIDFVTGKPTEADVCWQCRLRELVEMFNLKSANQGRPRAILHWSPPMYVPVVRVDPIQGLLQQQVDKMFGAGVIEDAQP